MQTEPIRSKKHIKEMAGYYLKKRRASELPLIVLGVNTGLRISDLLRLMKADVYDFDTGKFCTHIHTTKKRLARGNQLP